MARRVSFIVSARNDGFMKALDQSAKRMDRFGRKLQRQGRAMSTYLTAPTLAAGGAAVKMAADFEGSLSKIEGLVGVARSEVQGMRGDVLNLAGQTSRAPQELADALFFVTSAGFRGAEAMDVLEKSAKASAAGLGETKFIADLVTSTINAYGAENIDAAEATDVLTAAVREGKLESETLAPVMGRLLPLASELGISFSEVSGFLAAMSRTGLDARQSSTALRGVMAKLIKPTQMAKTQLAEYGLTAEGLRGQLEEKGLLSVLRTLQTTFGDNQEAMGKVFEDVEALTGVLNILGQDADTVSGIMDGVADSTGDMNEAFEVASKTAQFKFNKALASVKANAIEMGAIMLPIVTDLLEEVTRLSKQFAALDDETKKNIIRYAALAATIGPVLVGLGGMIRMVSSLTKGVVTLTGWFQKLNLSMKANVYLAVAAAIALIGVQIYRANERAKEFNKTLNDALTEPASSLEKLNKAIVAVKEQLRLIREGAEGTSVDPTTLESYKQLERQLETLVQKRNDLAQKQTWDIEPGEGVTETQKVLNEVDELLESVGQTATETQKGLRSELSQNNEAYDDIINKIGDVTWAEMQQARAIVATNKRIQEQIEWREKMAETVIGLAKVQERETPAVPFSIVEVKKTMKQYRDELEKSLNKWKEFNVAFKEIGGEFKQFLAGELSSAVLSFGKALGASLSGAQSTWQTGFEKIIMVILDFAASLARLAAAIGGVMVFIPGMQAIGVGLLAAGLALQAVSTGFSMGIEKRASNRERRATQVNDALIRSDGSIVKFHPDDDILAMKDFGNLQPSMSGSQVIHNMLNLDGRVVWENQKAVNYRRGR